MRPSQFCITHETAKTLRTYAGKEGTRYGALDSYFVWVEPFPCFLDGSPQLVTRYEFEKRLEDCYLSLEAKKLVVSIPAFTAEELGMILPSSYEYRPGKTRALSIHQENFDSWDVSYGTEEGNHWTQSEALCEAMAKMLIELAEIGVTA